MTDPELTDLFFVRKSWQNMGIVFDELIEPNATYPRTALEISPDDNLPLKWFEFDQRGKFIRALP